MAESTLPVPAEMPQIKILIPNKDVLVRLHEVGVQKALGKPPAPTTGLKGQTLNKR